MKALGSPRADESGSEKRPAHRSAMRPQEPGEDTAFMEQILRELSAQNEHARSPLSTGPRSAANHGPLEARSERTPDAQSREVTAPVTQGPSAPHAVRSPTVRVERDGGFRTDEGTPSARAYLPSRTLAPGRSAPHETVSVHVSDPRRLPTLRVPRDRVSSTSSSRRGSIPPPEDVVPTLRSAPERMPQEAPPSTVRWWIGALMIAAVAGAIAVTLAAHLWSAPASASGAGAGSATPTLRAPSSTADARGTPP